MTIINRKFKLPDIVGGYEIFEGLVSFVRPSEYALNLIKNPRMWSTDGYSALGDTDITQTHDEQYRGLFSLYCADSTGSYNGLDYEIALVGESKYKFSADIKLQRNNTIYIYLDTTGSQDPDTATLILENTSTGRWQRVNWEFSAPSSGTFYISIATNAGTPFYTDGWLLFETEDLSGEPENYFDGDTLSYTTLADYSWSGGRDTSFSIRRAGSGASGREVFLSDLGFIVQGTVGLGKNPVANIATALPTGGGYYQDTIPAIRSISLAGKIISGSRSEFMNVRRMLIDLFKPDRTPVKQSMLMRVYNLDGRGIPLTPVLEAHVVYVSGLEGAYVSDYSESLQLQFVQYDQSIIEDKDNASEIDTTEIESYGIDLITPEGEIADIESTVYATIYWGRTRSIEISQSGELYVGGKGRNAVVDPRHIIKYDGSSWSLVSGGYGDSFADEVLAVKEFHTNYIAIGGTDTSTKTMKIYSRSSESMTAYPTSAPNNTVHAFATKSAVLYVGGEFTSPYNYLAIYDLDDDSWSQFDSAPNDIVRCIKLSRDEKKLFVGGDFTSIGSDTHNHIAYYDFEENAWSAMGVGLGSDVYDIAEGLDGTIYACGVFTTIQSGAVNATMVARFRWQDAEWTPLENESLWNTYASSDFDSINALAVSKDGTLYFGGNRSDPASYADPPKPTLFKYVNSTTVVPAHYLTGTVYSLKEAANGGVYVGSTNNVLYDEETEGFSRVLNLGNVEVENATSYPEFHVRGPGTLFAIENHTTKQGLYFDSLQLYRGDRLVIKLDPITGISMSGIPNALSYLSAGSDINFSLAPGTNKISISLENRYEFLGSPSYETELGGVMLAGLNALNTNNGEHFYIDHDYDVVAGEITIEIQDCDTNAIASGTIAAPYSDYLALSEQNSSGVTGSIWVEGDTSDYTAEVAYGLVSVVWKNRRWSISEESE